MKASFNLLFITFLISLYYSGKALSQDRSEKMMTISIDSVGWVKLMKFGNHFLYRPGETAADLGQARRFADRALVVAEKLDKSRWKADASLLIARILREGGKANEGIHFIDSALSFYKISGNALGEGNALVEKSYTINYDLQGARRRAEMVRQAADAFSRSGQKKQEADARRLAGDYFQSSDLGEGLIELKKSAALYEKIKFKDMHGVYSLLGAYYGAIGIHTEGVKYGLLAVKFAAAANDTTMQLCTIYNRLGKTYHGAGELHLAREYFQKGLEVALRWNDANGIYILSYNLTKLLNTPIFRDYKNTIHFSRSVLLRHPTIVATGKVLLMTAIVVGYDALGKLDSAQYFLDRANSLFQREGDANYVVAKALMATAAGHYILCRKLDLAKREVSSLRAVAKESSQPEDHKTYLRLQYRLDSISGNYYDAFKHFQNLKVITDSLLSAEKYKHISALTFTFDTERKDQMLKTRAQNIELLTKKSVLQQQLLENAQLNRNITAAFLILSVLFLALLYNRYKIKQRTSVATAENNRTLKKMVNEREWLIRELHHRVKNNLQTIMSLLESQAAYLSDEALDAIQDSQHRVQAMSLIHQKLYLTDNLATVEMSSYIRELTDYLMESFSDKTCHLSLDLDPITLDVAKAIPIGLILNEAVTNSLKYAFPDGRKGSITVRLKRPDNSSKIALSVIDDGFGLPEKYISGKPGSMGLILIHGLAGELEGEVQVNNENGTQMTIEFEECLDFGQLSDLKSEAPTSQLS